MTLCRPPSIESVTYYLNGRLLREKKWRHTCKQLHQLHYANQHEIKHVQTWFVSTKTKLYRARIDLAEQINRLIRKRNSIGLFFSVDEFRYQFLRLESTEATWIKTYFSDKQKRTVFLNLTGAKAISLLLLLMCEKTIVKLWI